MNNFKIFIWKNLLIIFLFLLFSCSEKEGEVIPSDGSLNTENSIVKIAQPEFVFGFIGQNRYAYCPTVSKQDDGSIHLFFCGNPQSMIMVDNIYHIKINPDGSKTTPKSVLQPGTSGSWDDHHTCDPSVIEGEFKWGNTTYKYAMFYLGNKYGVYYNEIGIAFSNDLDADSWIKFPEQIVRKTWNSDGDQLIGNGGKSWGVGQPSVVSIDGKGKLLLTYTIGDISGTRIVWCQADFSDMDNYIIDSPTTIVQSGLKTIDNQSSDYTCNSDFAINKEKDKIVMIRPVQPMPNEYPSYISSTLELDYMNFSDFIAQRGSWIPIYRITPADTSFPRNHNAALLRNNFGWIEDWEEPTFYFSVSRAAPDVQPSGSGHAEWTYQIWKSKIIKQ
ncbi:sugar-binding protein [Porphyromonadaceae sp. NP-X]|nr:sugar-binding protein [Porphyromonadaceae sp. NP-X]